MVNDRIVCGATPLPASPTRGEVPIECVDVLGPGNGLPFTSPLVGEAGRGVPRAPHPEVASC